MLEHWGSTDRVLGCWPTGALWGKCVRELSTDAELKMLSGGETVN